jgi:uracil-DNA glycosylase family 4
MSDREQIKEHLAFASELGVAGVSRDPAWRAREDRGRARDNAGRVRESAGPEGESVGQRFSGAETPASEGRPHDAAAVATSQTGEAVVLVRSAAEVLATIQADIGPACMRCKLHRLGRTQVVFGVGNPEARLMFVGEAPGADEDEQGIPFVGRAGQLLTKIIEAIGLTREDVYIANVIKCRPPQNRNPEADEVETCEPFLFQQIDAIRPAVIVALGKFGAQTLLRTAEPISRLRGRVFDFRGAKLMPTFHPAYLLRNPSSKRDVWEDMKEVRRLLQQTP